MGAGRQTRWIRRGLGAAVIGLFLTTPALAEVPHLLRYQGQAVDAKGVPLEGPHTLTVRLYDGETGGTPLWVETHPDVPLTGGHFSLLLGSVTPLAPVDWTQPRWLAVQVDAEPELAPRQRITSVPLALTAERLAVPMTTSTITDDAKRLVPSGAIMLWTGASCPAGYTRLATYDNQFLVASASAGTTGGSDFVTLTVGQIPSHAHAGPSHTHTTPAHTHTIAGRIQNDTSGKTLGALKPVSNMGASYQSIGTTGNPPGTAEGDNSTGGGGTDNTGLTGGGQPFDNRPAFKTILLCQKD